MIHNTMIILIVMVYHALWLLSITMIIQQLYHDCVMIIHYPLSIIHLMIDYPLYHDYHD